MSKLVWFFLTLLSLAFSREPLDIKILHLSFHKGCINEIEGLAKELNFDVTSWFIPNLPPLYFDGKSKGACLYNIGHDRAKNIWERHKDYFKTFDLILTSDTTPLSRIFLQNHSKIPLVIWVCNRFDYADYGSLDCNFPDFEYYNLLQNATRKSNVKIMGYTPFENCYAKMKGVDIGEEVIKPVGFFKAVENIQTSIPPHIVKHETFFIPPYHNDKILPDQLDKLQIPYYKGRYSGREDLKDFKGVIHIPYAWSNLALFENWDTGLVYFIPSKKFLLQLKNSINFFWSPPFKEDFLECSEWYNPKYKSYFVYFDSWKDLKQKITDTDYKKIKSRVQQFMVFQKKQTIEAWYQTFKSLTSK